MFFELKDLLHKEGSKTTAMEEALNSLMNDTMDRVIDDEDILLSDDDDQIDKLIDSIPESDDSDVMDDEVIEDMVENMIPETVGISHSNYNGFWNN